MHLLEGFARGSQQTLKALRGLPDGYFDQQLKVPGTMQFALVLIKIGTHSEAYATQEINIVMFQ